MGILFFQVKRYECIVGARYECIVGASFTWWTARFRSICL